MVLFSQSEPTLLAFAFPSLSNSPWPWHFNARLLTVAKMSAKQLLGLLVNTLDI